MDTKIAKNRAIFHHYFSVYLKRENNVNKSEGKQRRQTNINKKSINTLSFQHYLEAPSKILLKSLPNLHKYNIPNMDILKLILIFLDFIIETLRL